MFSKFFVLKIVPLWDNVQIHGRGRQAANDNTIPRMRLFYGSLGLHLETHNI